jgi:hypothetical protein
VSSGAGLTINVAAGSYRLGNTLVNFTGSSGIAVASNTTNYVFFGSGGLTVRLPAFPTDESFIPLAVVTTSVTGVTGVTDRRISQSDTREHAVLQLLTPEYDKVTYQGDAADNVGTLSMSQDNMTHQNYYVWTTTRSTLQDYDIFVRVQVPQDFVRWKSGGGRNNVHLNYRSTSANASDNALDLSVFDTNGTPVSLSATSWATAQIDFLGTPTWQPGQEFLLKFHLSAKNGYQIQLGSVELNSTHLTGQ